MPITYPDWYRNSGIGKCEVCDGTGWFDKTPWLHGNDPDKHVIECEACDGEGIIPCQTCGYDIPTQGHDCLVCDTLCSLGNDELKAIDPERLAACFAAGLEAARKEIAT